MSDKASFEMLKSLGQKKQVVEEFGPKKTKFSEYYTQSARMEQQMCLEQGVLDLNHAIAIIPTAQAAVAESKCLLIQQPHPVGSFLRWSRLPCNKGKVRNRLEARYSLVGGWEGGGAL
jgi:hypothetical protein